MLKKIFRVFQFLLAPFKLALIVLPFITLMVYTNYRIDCSGLFQGDLTIRTIVELMQADKAISGFSQMDQRAVNDLYIKLMPEDQIPDTVAVGSSRVMQITNQVAGGSFYNAGVTGSDYKDVMNSFYLLEKYEKLPKRLLIGVDPWVFRSDAIDRRTDLELFEEFLSVSMGKPSDYVKPEPSDAYKFWDAAVQKYTDGKASLTTLNITDETLPALFDPAYFQGNLLHYQAQQASDSAITEDGQVIPYREVAEQELQTIDEEVKMPDGTVWYASSFRNAGLDEVLIAAMGQAGTFLYMVGYPQLETAQCALFEEFIDHVQSRGVEVVFFLSPYHPFVYQHVYHNDVADHAGFFEVEPYLRAYAAQKGIPVVGSYDPEALGLTEEDFFDGLHVRSSGIEKYFGGFDPSGSILPGTEVDGTAPLATARSPLAGD
ncbi:MAG: hypothetical protein IJ347_02730 [Faecalibacterium sp.]|nr:hypothetical protein [Faecalibacterium sp.]